MKNESNRKKSNQIRTFPDRLKAFQASLNTPNIPCAIILYSNVELLGFSHKSKDIRGRQKQKKQRRKIAIVQHRKTKRGMQKITKTKTEKKTTRRTLLGWTLATAFIYLIFTWAGVTNSCPTHASPPPPLYPTWSSHPKEPYQDSQAMHENHFLSRSSNSTVEHPRHLWVHVSRDHQPLLQMCSFVTHWALVMAYLWLRSSALTSLTLIKRECKKAPNGGTGECPYLIPYVCIPPIVIQVPKISQVNWGKEFHLVVELTSSASKVGQFFRKPRGFNCSKETYSIRAISLPFHSICLSKTYHSHHTCPTRQYLPQSISDQSKA